MPLPKETPLKEIKEWPGELVQRAEQSWLRTAEEIVAVSATPGGLRSLAEQLQVPEEEAARLVNIARAHLDPAVVEQLEQPADTRRYGLGALKPPSDTPKP
jgi:hypothetical protein